MNNENNPHIASVYVGSLATDDSQVPLIHFPKKVKITGIKLINNAAIPASDTNFVSPAVGIVGGDDIAEMDSRDAHEGAIAKNVGKAFNIVTDTIPAGSDLELDYQEAGTVALTGAVVQIEYYPL